MNRGLERVVGKVRAYGRALLLLACWCWAVPLLPAAEPAVELLRTSGFNGGLVVHVGCGEAQETVQLASAGRWVVCGLDRDALAVQAARARVAQAGLSGPVSILLWTGGALPFVDNTVNLMVLEDKTAVALEECKRVLCPGGRVCFRQDGGWQTVVKEHPDNTDEWTHALYDASGGSVSKDQVAGPPKGLQWTAGPEWTRHHEAVIGFQNMVTASGRLFYLMDEGPQVSLLLPPDWELIARDAYNGKTLWKRPFKRWVSPLFPYKSGPTQMTRRMVVSGNRLFIAANLDEGVTVLDAGTGETIRVLDQTAACEEILYYQGILYLVTNDTPVTYQTGHRYSAENAWSGQEKWIRAVDPETGQALWSHKTPIAPMSIAVSERGVFFHDGTCIRALDIRSGQPLFKTDPVLLDNVIATATTPTLAVCQDVLMFWGGAEQPEFRVKSGTRASNSLRTFTALSAVDGRKLWSYQTPEFSTGFECPKDILVVDGRVWLGIMMGGGERAGTWTGRNIHTGEIEKEFKPPEGIYWFHQRCHRSKATENFIVSGRTGIEFISPKTGWDSINHWIRGACMVGTMPANGLIYQPPHPCACYAESLLRGFNALAPVSAQPAAAQDGSPRLQQGVAFDRPLEVPSVPGSGQPDEWPAFRHDNARSCSSASRIPTELAVGWQVHAGTRLSAMTVAGGRLFVADKDAHALHALEAETGKNAWTFLAGGRIDSPPAVALGRVLFGSQDGYLYCLSATDGALAWRYRVAPGERYLLAEEQLESVWPVHGSPLVIDNRVYVVAGRSAFLDGGMRFVCLDIATGKTIHETVLDENDPITGGKIADKMTDRTMPVCNPDILSSDGRSIFMNTQRFDLDGSRPTIAAMRNPTQQLGEDAHLFVDSGFLDDSGFHRTLMVYGRAYSGGDGENHVAAKFAPAGMMLAFNTSQVFGFARMPDLYRWVRELEWHIYRASKTERKPMPSTDANQAAPAPTPDAQDVVLHTASKDEKELARLKTSLFSTTIKYEWSNHDPDLYVNAMVLTHETLFVAGPPAIRNETTLDALARWQGAQGGNLWCLSTDNGAKTGELKLPSPPVYEGMAAAYDRLYVAMKDGSILCLVPGKRHE